MISQTTPPESSGFGEVPVERMREIALRRLWMHSKQVKDLSSQGGPQVVVHGEGCWIQDWKGRDYLDAISGLWVVNAGHGRREIREAILDTLDTIAYAPSGTTTIQTIALAEQLARVSPVPDARVFFVSGGSEANETALKIARKFHQLNGVPSKYKVISRRGSYHGSTLATLSAGGAPIGSPRDFEPLMPGNVHVSQPLPMRCLYCSNSGRCDLRCADEIEETILHEGPDTVAALIGEPISESAGVIIPEEEYWSRVRQICSRYRVLVIADEVITGSGRTGRMFASEHWPIEPDILTTAKGLASGYMPIGACVVSGHVADAFIGDSTRTLRHILTFGGQPVASAAALANLNLIQEQGLLANSSNMGSYLLEKLKPLEDLSVVAAIHGGKGLLLGVELTPNRQNNTRFSSYPELTLKSTALLQDYGLLTRAWNHIPIAPPLGLSRYEADFIVDRLTAALEEIDALARALVRSQP